MLSQQAEANRSYLEADLLGGIIECSQLAHHGIPEARRANFTEEPRFLLERLLLTVEPDDLSPAARTAFMRLRGAWKRNTVLCWEVCGQAGRGFEPLSLGMALHAPRAARKLLELAQAREGYTQAQRAAAEALAAAEDALRGL